MSDILLTGKTVLICEVFTKRKPEKWVLLIPQKNILIQLSNKQFQIKLLIIVSNVHQAIQTDLSSCEASLLLQFAVGGSLGFFSWLHLAAHKVIPPFVWILLTNTEKSLALIPVQDHNAIVCIHYIHSAPLHS